MIGDQQDFVARLRSALPNSWFPDNAPVLTAVLNGFGCAWAWLYGVIVFAGQQARLATAIGGWLDLIAEDYGGDSWARVPNESDSTFRARLAFYMRRERTTRASLIANLTQLTGRPPKIFEPAFPPDTGGLNNPSLGWNLCGGWGSLTLPYQCFVTAYRPHGGGIANLGGWSSNPPAIGLGGWNTGALAWANLLLVQGTVTDAQIYSEIATSMPVASIAWATISN